MAIELTDKAKIVAQKVFKGQPVTAAEVEALILELGADAGELAANFVYAVDDYLEACAAEGVEVQMPDAVAA